MSDKHAAGAFDREGLQRTALYWVPQDPDGRVHLTISSEKVAREHGVPSKILIEYLKSEIAEAEACRTLPFTLLLVISYAMMAIAHDDAPNVRSVQDSLREDIIENGNYAFTGPYFGDKNMEGVNSFADFWLWLRHGMLPLLFDQEREFHEGYNPDEPWYIDAVADGKTEVPPERRGFWLHYNRIVGGVRLVQERSGGDGDFPNDGFLCETAVQVLPLYNSKCVGGLDYNIDPELGLPAERAETTIDPQREQWLYVWEDYDNIEQTVIQMEQNDWLDRQTKKIEMAIPVYNAELGMHTLIRANFYFSRGGHIWKKVIPQSQYASWHSHWLYGLYDTIWMLCLLYIFISETAEIHSVIQRKGLYGIISDYINFWNFVDWSSVLCGLAIIIFWAAGHGDRTELNSSLEKLGSLSVLEDTASYEAVVKDYFALLEDNIVAVRRLRLMVAAYPLVIIFRLFKLFSAQPRLALVTKTLSFAAGDLFHFMIIFLSVFVTFMIFGIVLFGREVRSFTTVPRAMVSCFRIMLGDIDWAELSVIGRTEAAIWLWLFVIIVSLLMLNMILAIIMDNYEEVKLQAGYSETLVEETQQAYRRWRGIRNGLYVPLTEVLEAVGHDPRLQANKKRRGKSLTVMLGGMFSSSQNDHDDDKEHDDMDDEISHSQTLDHELLKWEDPLIKVDNLITDVSETCRSGKMSETQAIDILMGAVEDYHEKHKKGADLNEVLQLSHSVNERVQKMARLARKVNLEKDRGPVEELRHYASELEVYIADVEAERQANQREMERVQALRSELEQRLLRLAPSIGFPTDGNRGKTRRGAVSAAAMLPHSPGSLDVHEL
mmetsp:Transcript_64915/g.155047  ORF Transcript_64915/g.155047 Transcript_64915/m.155047 type:complete len:832 (-) Transcript_64915:8-2503(-)